MDDFQLQSPDIRELLPALIEARKSFSNLKKDGVNTFFGNSRYATLAAVLDSVQEALTEQGFSIVGQAHEAIQSMEDGKITETETRLITKLIHISGQWIATDYPISPIKNDPQSLGSAVTYARRYALMALLSLAPDDDDDGNAASAHIRESQSEETRTRQVENFANNRGQILTEIKSLSSTLGRKEGAEVKTHFATAYNGKDMITEATVDELKEYRERLKNGISQMAQAAVDAQRETASKLPPASNRRKPDDTEAQALANLEAAGMVIQHEG